MADGLILWLAKARAGWRPSHPLGFISQASRGHHPCTLACKDLQQLWVEWLLLSLDLLSLPFVIFRHWITSEEKQTEETHHISRKC